MNFESFDEIKRFNKTEFTITQKIHGTNAQIFIVPVEQQEWDASKAASGHDSSILMDRVNEVRKRAIDALEAYEKAMGGE